jgi:hypothetical protein
MNKLPVIQPILHFEALRKEARVLLRVLLRNDSVPEKYRQFGPVDVAARLSDAQYMVARRYGFKSWSALKARIAPRFHTSPNMVPQSNNPDPKHRFE